jgi:hypothetical protein
MSNAAKGPAAAGSPRQGTASRRLAAGAAAIASVILGGIAGCAATSHGASAPKPMATATVTVTAKAVTAATASSSAVPSATAAPAAPAVPAAPPAPVSQAGPPPCPTRSLGVKAGISQGTTTSTYTVIDFTNISSVTCTLYGFPGVSFGGGMPVSQIGPAAAESHAAPRVLVTLAPGAVANALLQIVHSANYPASQCDPVKADYLAIYPPNQTTPVMLAYLSPTCAKPIQILTVSVVEPGAGS